MGTVSGETPKETPKTKAPKGKGKVIGMAPLPKLSPGEKEVMDKAIAIQNKQQAEQQAEEDKIIAELVAKFGLGKDEINSAAEFEKDLSSPETGIKSVVEAMDYYKEMTKAQAMFLAITSNSRGNQLQATLNEYARKLDDVEKQLEAILIAQALELEAKDSVLEITTEEQKADAMAEESAKEALGTIPEGE